MRELVNLIQKRDQLISERGDLGMIDALNEIIAEMKVVDAKKDAST